MLKKNLQFITGYKKTKYVNHIQFEGEITKNTIYSELYIEKWKNN